MISYIEVFNYYFCMDAYLNYFSTKVTLFRWCTFCI